MRLLRKCLLCVQLDLFYAGQTKLSLSVLDGSISSEGEQGRGITTQEQGSKHWTLSLQFAKGILSNYHKLDVAAVGLGDELGLVALAADPLWLAVLDGALQV